MYVGYLAQRKQLMLHVNFEDSLFTEEFSDQRVEEVKRWLVSWWGGEIPETDGDAEYNALRMIAVLHNLICQDARLPLFDLPVIDTGGDKPACWVPTLNGLNPQVHSLALRFALLAITQETESACQQVLVEAVPALKKKAGDKVLGSSDGSIPILSEAHDMGFYFYPQVEDIVQVGQGARSRLIHVSASDADSGAGMLISENKAMMAAVFSRVGIPTPETLSTQSPDIASLVLRKLQGPLIVKPERGARGVGVQTGITSEAHLKRAISLAIQASPVNVALVQRQLSGDCHRVQILNGEVMWASTRYPKSVVADGKSTIAQLIDAANESLEEMPVRRRIRSFPSDELAIATVRRQGFTMNAVAPEGQRITLRPITSVADGGDTKTITETLHPANAALCIEATKVCRLNTAGIDFFSVDPTTPWFENGGCILEVNYKPQIFNRLSDRIAKSPQRDFVTKLISGADKLPVYAFIGASEAKKNVIQRHQELVDQGVNAWLCVDEGISGPECIMRPIKEGSLLQSLSSLMQNPRVEALCLQVGLWGGKMALPITHVTTMDEHYPEGDDLLAEDWSRISHRLRAVITS